MTIFFDNIESNRFSKLPIDFTIDRFSPTFLSIYLSVNASDDVNDNLKCSIYFFYI